MDGICRKVGRQENNVENCNVQNVQAALLPFPGSREKKYIAWHFKWLQLGREENEASYEAHQTTTGN